MHIDFLNIYHRNLVFIVYNYYYFFNIPTWDTELDYNLNDWHEYFKNKQERYSLDKLFKRPTGWRIL
jgi:hypothetical protein